MARNEVTDKDMGYSALLVGINRLANEPAVFVGVRGDAGSVDGVPLLLIASANEFGTSDGHVPERSYIRSTVDERRATYLATLSKIVGDEVDGKQLAVKGLDRLGVRAVADVQRKITSLKEPPNTAGTIRKKGSSNPLIDTGRLRQSIAYEVKPLG